MQQEKMRKEDALPKVIFLDRDGTMNEEVHYLHRPEDVRMIPGTAQAIRMFHEAGYRVVVVTNQAGVARGYYTEADVEALHSYMNSLLMKEGARVDAFYYCPHHPEHGIGAYRTVCRCRKPGTGMFEAAERDLGKRIDRAASFMIGDKLIDAQAGHHFGVRSVLVGTGYGAGAREARPQEGAGAPEYDMFAEDLLEAARMICGGV
ncbi:HAD family hydrolase [Clostridiaceae bacterium]|nr:HAD family hydrolase [Clostridiaceae bacterium]